MHVLCTGHRNRGVLPKKEIPHLSWLVCVHTLSLVARPRQLFNDRNFFFSSAMKTDYLDLFSQSIFYEIYNFSTELFLSKIHHEFQIHVNIRHFSFRSSQVQNP